jgi:hypothetical protein
MAWVTARYRVFVEAGEEVEEPPADASAVSL